MRSSFYTLLFLICLAPLSAQNLELSRLQMEEDFEVLLENIQRLNSSIKIKKALYNYHILDTIKSYKQELVDIDETYTAFYRFVRKTLNTCIDGHSYILTPHDWLNGKQIKLNLYLAYKGGKYYTTRPFDYKGQHYPSASEIAKINGKNVDPVIRDLIPHRYMMRWDEAHQKFASELFYLADNFIDQGQVVLSFKHGDKYLTDTFYLNQAVDFKKPIIATTGQKKVEYFQKPQILYIRVPDMNWSNRKFFKKKIAEIGDNKLIKKVLIDVRSNLGGSSEVGRTIFKMLLSKPMYIHKKVYGNPPDFISKKYKKQHAYSKNSQAVAISGFDDIQLYEHINKVEKIKPYRKSLKTDADIYIIGNEWIYSAGGAIFMFAKHSKEDNIYAIGTKTGHILGEFTDPIQFELPHSKIICAIAPNMDFTKVTRKKEIFQEQYDFEIRPSIEEYKLRYEYKGDLYGERYLLQYDPYFKPILKEMRN